MFARLPWLALVVLTVALSATPLVGRAVLVVWGPRANATQPSYLPALEAFRERRAFVADPVDDLQRMKPGCVIIGDSMAGRIDFDIFTALTGQPVAPILQNATGSAYWFLVFKNYVVASGIKPDWVLVFFRDTNLTDPMFRLTGPYRPPVDEVARDQEPELNVVVAQRTNGSWFRVHQFVDRVYQAEALRAWLEPPLVSWPARVAAGSRRRQMLLDRINEAFALENLRPMSQADAELADDRDADFGANVPTSILPAWLAMAREHHLKLCFVRVLRRPVDGQPPPESPALQRYVKDLRAYLESQGAGYLDDRDVPELARIAYADGDHIARESLPEYTNRFAKRLAALPR